MVPQSPAHITSFLNSSPHNCCFISTSDLARLTILPTNSSARIRTMPLPNNNFVSSSLSSKEDQQPPLRSSMVIFARPPPLLYPHYYPIHVLPGGLLFRVSPHQEQLHRNKEKGRLALVIMLEAALDVLKEEDEDNLVATGEEDPKLQDQHHG
jgi:hypothetical protein